VIHHAVCTAESGRATYQKRGPLFLLLFGPALGFVAPFAARLLRIDLPPALRADAAFQLHDVVGARTRSHDDPLSSINQVNQKWYSSLVDSRSGDKGDWQHGRRTGCLAGRPEKLLNRAPAQR
jgi:hypothetical protein